jgi:hypothetical protein
MWSIPNRSNVSAVQPPAGSARALALPLLVCGRYDIVTHTTNVKTVRNTRAITPRKIAPTTEKSFGVPNPS